MQPEVNGAEAYWREKSPRDGERPTDARKSEETHVLCKHSEIKHERARNESCANIEMIKPVAHKN